MKIRGLSILIMIFLISSSGLSFTNPLPKIEKVDEEMDRTIDTQAEVNLISNEIVENRRVYPIVSTGNYFWVGTYFVEFLGEGLGTWITAANGTITKRSEEHTSELQSH